MKREYLMKVFVVLLLFTVLNGFVFANGGNDGGAEEIKLTVWINGSDSYIGPEEQKLPQDQWYISQAFKRFEAANPGVTIELTVPPDQEGAHQSFKAAGLAGNAPDIANLWTGQPIFALKDVILPLDNLVPADDLKNIFGWESVRLNFAPDGTILGYPASQNQLCFLLYNKSIIRQAGLDFDSNPPRTFDEFSTACAKIKDLGIDPIVVDEDFPWFFAWIGDYWWAQVSELKNIIAETNGEKKFVDDKGFINALKYYHSLYVNEYFNKDMGTSADSWNRFLQGQAAMTPVVTSFFNDAEKALGEDAGILMPPDAPNAVIKDSTIGGPGQSLVVAKDTKYPEMAVKLISFLNSKEEVMLAQKIMPVPTVRIDMTIEELGWDKDSELAKIIDYGSRYIYWPDNTLSSGVADVFYTLTPLVALGKMTPEELAMEMDKNAGK